MGRKIEMTKITDVAKRQVTFSKRRSSLLKKIQEIAMLCDANVAFVAFSPAGRVHKFCSLSRMEDVLQCYITLPTQQRLSQMRNTQENPEMLSEVNQILCDDKLDHLGKQIESLEDQTQKSSEVLEFLEANLRDYEPSPEVLPSLHKYSWCERNLMHSLKSVMTRKHQGKFLGSSSSSLSLPSYLLDTPATFKLNDMEQNKPGNLRCPWQMEVFNQDQGNNSPSFPSHLLTELDPWISPHSARVRDRIFQTYLEESNGKVVTNEDPFNLMKAQVEQNAPFGLKPLQPHSFGHHVENQNLQDGSLPLNQFNTNHELQHPFPSHDSCSSSMQDSGLGSNTFELYRVPFDWEIQEPNQQDQVSGLKVDFSNPQPILPNMASNLGTWNDGTSHGISGFSQALDNPNPVPAVHSAPGGANQGTAGFQNSGEMDWLRDEMLKELFSD